MEPTRGDLLIFSGEGVAGTWERYFGARTTKAIRAKLSRERAGGDRWAYAYIETDMSDDTENRVYMDIDSGKLRSVPTSEIRENPAAKLAASKKSSPASRENGKKGGRPKKEAKK